MEFEHRNSGTCSSRVRFELDGRTVKNVVFTGGCNGNLQGISRLVEGMDIDEVISRVRGISCGLKPTSCPDQLARALEEAKASLKL